MSAADLRLVTRAETGLARLRQARAVQQDQEARTRVRFVMERAVEARTALEAMCDVLPALESSGVRPGAIPGNLLAESKKARTDLRQAATTSLRGEGTRPVERLVGKSVHEALERAEVLAKQRLNDLNKAVDAWRKDNLPQDIDAEIIDLPGFPGSLRIRLQRHANLLKKPVTGLSAQQLPRTIEELRQARTDWLALKDLYDAALEKENPEIKAFLARAGSEEGATWSMVTPAVRRWLDDADDANVVRIRLS